MKYCITTFLSNDYFQYYIPLFIYSCKKANPKADIKIFVRKELSDKIDTSGAEVIQNMFNNYSKGFKVNAMRFLVPAEHLKDYDYVYFTDIDFIFLPHKKSLLEYHTDVMKNTGLPYSGHRGPIKNRRSKERTWIGNKTRIAAGAFMASRKWLDETEEMRARWLKKLFKKRVFREYDEVMLYKICTEAGFKTPSRIGCFLDGQKYDVKYRDIHLGDFKFNRWKRTNRMKVKFLTDGNVKAYLKLEKDKGWQKVLENARKCAYIKVILRNLKNHLKKR